MKKFLFSLLFLFISLKIYSAKILILQIENVKNYQIVSYYYDLTDIDLKFFKNFNCKNFIFSKYYNINTIIDYLLQKSVKLNSVTILKNSNINDNTLIISKIIIDTKYKILEKDGKKYYIFDVCYPEKEKESIIKKILQWLM